MPYKLQRPHTPSDPTPDFLRALTRDASTIVVCTLQGVLKDIYKDPKEPDIFYDAACDVSDVIRGKVKPGPIRFIWQVERDARMPAPGTEIVAYLKTLSKPFEPDPELRLIALDTGVFDATTTLKATLHGRKAPAPPK